MRSRDVTSDISACLRAWFIGLASCTASSNSDEPGGRDHGENWRPAMELDLSPLPLEPEVLWEFRAAQLVLLLDVTMKTQGHGVDIDRLAFYDFFSANPFLVYPKSAPERLPLTLAGFDPSLL